MKTKENISRRTTLKGLGAIGAAAQSIRISQEILALHVYAFTTIVTTLPTLPAVNNASVEIANGYSPVGNVRCSPGLACAIQCAQVNLRIVELGVHCDRR